MSTLSRPTPARPTIWSGSEDLGVDGRGGADEQGVSVLDSLQQFRAVRTVDPPHLDGVTEGIHGGLGELVGDENDGTGILAHRIS